MVRQAHHDNFVLCWGNNGGALRRHYFLPNNEQVMVSLSNHCGHIGFIQLFNIFQSKYSMSCKDEYRHLSLFPISSLALSLLAD